MVEIKEGRWYQRRDGKIDGPAKPSGYEGFPFRVGAFDYPREKTADDVAAKAKVARMRAKHLGTYPKSRAKIRSRGFAPTR